MGQREGPCCLGSGGFFEEAQSLPHSKTWSPGGCVIIWGPGDNLRIVVLETHLRVGGAREKETSLDWDPRDYLSFGGDPLQGWGTRDYLRVGVPETTLGLGSQSLPQG